MTEDSLTYEERAAIKWIALSTWIRRNRSGERYGSAQELWFEMLKFYDGLRDD